MADKAKKQGTWIVVLLVVIVGILAFMFLRSDRDVVNMADDFSDNVEETIEDMDPNRTTGEKVGDAIGDFGEEIQEAADGN